MILIYGQWNRHKKLGRVADYCIRCNEPRAMRVLDHWEITHLYFIPLGRGKRVKIYKRCEHCRNEVGYDPDRYTGLCQDRKATLETLVDITHPTLPEFVASRMDLHDQAVSGDISQEERLQLIFETIAAYASEIEKRGSQSQLDVSSALALFAIPLWGLGGYLVGVGWQTLFGQGTGNTTMVGALVGLALGIFWLVYLVVKDVDRYFRRKCRRTMIARLVPLNPSLEDLEQTVMTLKQYGLRLGKVVKPHRLYLDLTKRVEEAQIGPISTDN